MKNTVLSNTMNRVSGATQRATKKLLGMAGAPADPDIIFYDNLKPDEIDAMVKEFGPDDVGEYVHDMEARRMKDATT